MEFTKMEGLGNDYVYVNCMVETVKDPAVLARKISDRHRGVGSDGLILIRNSDKADFRMDIYNADGSRAEMCGNGIRCVGKYLCDRGISKGTEMDIETLAGIRHLECHIKDGSTESVTVDMGIPVVAGRNLDSWIGAPGRNVEKKYINSSTSDSDVYIEYTEVSMGNPHAVVYVDDVAGCRVDVLGPMIENSGMFESGVNVEFVQVLDNTHIRMRVWERGSGETCACGTGACAAVAAGIAGNRTNWAAKVELNGGDLDVQYDLERKRIYMTGPARVVFDGRTDIF